jgi:xylulokinase
VKLLALDIGSSAVKAAVLVDGATVAGPARAPYPTTFAGVQAEIDPADLWRAIVTAVTAVTAAAPGSTGLDLMGLTSLGPAWIALDRSGEPLTPLVTHADRRSVEQARRLEREVGRERYLETAGNRPYPGGIAATTWRWYAEHAPDVLARADLVGSLTTWLHRRLTGARVIDPSHASFLGVYRTCTLDGWAPELVEAAGGRLAQLPDVYEADAPAGVLRDEAARELGLEPGLPVLAGCLDGSAAMLAAGRAAGGLVTGLIVDSVGSTDVLAMAVEVPAPRPRLLTRALGVGRRWVSVATLASAGSTLDWVHRTLFPDLPAEGFHALVDRLGAHPDPGSVRFRPYLSGERTTLNQPRGGFSGLTLATTRENLLSAVLEALAAASAARVARLSAIAEPRPAVYVTGGAATGVLYRDWPPCAGGPWRFEPLAEATLAGVSVLAEHPPV